MNCISTYELAQKIVAKYGTRDPFELIEAIPNMVLRMPTSISEEGLKGWCTIQNQFKYIVVNGLLVPEEQVVTAGHEIGHIFLHESRLRVHPMKDFDIYGAKNENNYSP